MLFSEIEARRSGGGAPGGGSNGASELRGTRGELAAGAEFQVSVSMLEIYNEQVFDLLGSRSRTTPAPASASETIRRKAPRKCAEQHSYLLMYASASLIHVM